MDIFYPSFVQYRLQQGDCGGFTVGFVDFYLGVPPVFPKQNLLDLGTNQTKFNETTVVTLYMN